MKKTLLMTAYSVMVLCSVLLFGITAFAGSGTAKLSARKKTIEMGSSFTLKMKNNKTRVKWAVIKGKNCVKLSQKSKNSVKVIGIKNGSAKVQAKVGKKRYICTIKIKKPTAPTITLLELHVSYKFESTRRLYSISPCKNVYVPDELVMYNAWQIAKPGKFIRKIPKFLFPLDMNSVYKDQKKIVNGITFRRMIGRKVTYSLNDMIYYMSDNSGNTDYKETIRIIKDNILFTYNYDAKYNEYICKGILYVR